jgi:hypothetical protein
VSPTRLVRCLVLALGVSAGCGGDGDAACVAECGSPCAFGNSFGVGRACTAGGGECGETPDRLAPFCTRDFDPEAPAFCTRPCEPGDDLAMCGEGARCDNGGSGSYGCVPLVCLDSDADADPSKQ